MSAIQRRKRSRLELTRARAAPTSVALQLVSLGAGWALFGVRSGDRVVEVEASADGCDAPNDLLRAFALLTTGVSRVSIRLFTEGVRDYVLSAQRLDDTAVEVSVKSPLIAEPLYATGKVPKVELVTRGSLGALVRSYVESLDRIVEARGGIVGFDQEWWGGPLDRTALETLRVWLSRQPDVPPRDGRE